MYHLLHGSPPQVSPQHYNVGAGVTYAVGQVAVYAELSVVWTPSTVFTS